MRINKSNVMGRLVAIPAGEEWRLAKVIFVSSHVRDMILLKLFDSKAPTPGALADRVGDDGTLYYTGIKPIRDGRWPVVGFEDVSDAERELTRRTSGGEIWVLDQHLGAASDEDLARLPKMLIHGGGLIEKYAAR